MLKVIEEFITNLILVTFSWLFQYHFCHQPAFISQTFLKYLIFHMPLKQTSLEKKERKKRRKRRDQVKNVLYIFKEDDFIQFYVMQVVKYRVMSKNNVNGANILHPNL